VNEDIVQNFHRLVIYEYMMHCFIKFPFFLMYLTNEEYLLCIIFIIVPTNAHIYIVHIILQMLLHVLVPLHHLQGAYILCLLKL